MSKRDRQLKQRLDELFSQASEQAETPPEAPGAEPENPSSGAGRPVELAAAAAPELPYLKAMIEQLPLPAYLKDREHTWAAVNSAFAQLIGHTPDTLLEHTDKEQADEAWQLDDRVLDNGQPEETQETISLPDGRIHTRRTRRTPLLTAKQDVRYVMGVVEGDTTPGDFHDVSQREHLEQDLQRLLAIESKRAVQLQTATEVSKAAGTILNVDELLPFVVNLIQQRFALYYVGLFLVDDARQNAILRAGTGEAGQIMLDRRHQLPLDDRSMIGWCIQRQMPRIALDVGQDAVRFNNPNLPDTRSELALPLVSRGKVLGAMTVQSQEAAAFGEQDIAILQTMSDQVATAIGNAQLFEQASQTRQQAEARLRETQFLQSVGQAVSSSLDLASVLEVVIGTLQRELGFTHIALALADKQAETVSIPRASGSAAGLQGLTRSFEQLHNDIIMDILRTGQIEVIDGWDDRFDREIYESQGHAELVRAFVPLRLRGESIGLLEAGYRRTERARITPEEVRLLGGLVDQIAIAVGNARLFEETRTRAEVQTALYDLSQVLASRLDVDQVLQEIYHGVSRLLDTANFYIGLYSPERNRVSFLLNITESHQDQEIKEISADQGLTGYIIRTKTPLLIHEGLRRWEVEHRISPVGELAASWLGVPLLVGQQVLGVMAIQNYTGSYLYDEHDRDLLMAIANQAAVALQNALLFERTQQNTRELAALNELGQAVTQQLEIEQVLEVAYQHLQPLLPVDAFFAALYDRESSTIAFPVIYDEGKRYSEPPFPFTSDSRTGQVILTGEPILDLLTPDDLAATTEVEGALGNVDRASASLLYVPLRVGLQTIGTLSIQSYQFNAYTTNTMQLVSNVANQVAIAIQNARLFEQTQRAARREQTLREITSHVRSSADPDVIARTAIRELGLALGRNTFIRLGDAGQLGRPPQADQEPPASGDGHNTGLEGGQ